ncbi:hypothetical protein C8R43DRAFT_908726, partial [Mycena crocata]
NMAEAVWKTVEKFGLQGRIIAFVMDNATNNDTLVEAFEKKCQALHIPFESRHARMRCMPHTIHLAALKLLEAIGVLTKDETKKAEGNSRESAYQDSAMESLSPEADNLATLAGDSPETVSTNPSSAVGRAVFKVSCVPLVLVSLAEGSAAPQDCSACSIQSPTPCCLEKGSTGCNFRGWNQ